VIVNDQALEVVGVVRDANVRDLSGITPALYRPLQPETMVQVVLTHGAGAAAPLAALVARIDPRARTVTRSLSSSIGGRGRGLQIALKLLAMNGSIALALAMFGLFGVFTNAVQERTREIGIRIAIGARAAHVLRATFASTARSLVMGLVLGVVIAVAGGYLLRHLFYGLGAADPIAYLWVALVLTAAGAAATYLPAQRALRVDPVVALRCE